MLVPLTFSKARCEADRRDSYEIPIRVGQHFRTLRPSPWAGERVSWGRHLRGPPAGRLNATGVSSPTVLEAGSR